jgi:hypothetical protein
MSAVCPSCGVAVTAGYVKCPKCHAPLPSNRVGGASSGPGGTAVAGTSRPPVLAFVAGAAVLIAIVLFFALRKSDKSEAAPVPEPTASSSDPVQAAQPQPTDPSALPDPNAGSGSAAPDPTRAINVLDRALKKERLWGTVQTTGVRVDVRTGSCSDPQMGPLLDANAAALREVGLTRVRCMEQSGAVVFERDL